MTDKGTILQIVGSLMKHPQFLSQSDKYQLSPNDFEGRFTKYIFIAIDSLYRSGVTSINPIDVENYLSTNEAAKSLFSSTNGIEYLQDALALSDEKSFPYYYKKLKKFNLLTSLSKQGINTEEFYIENLANPKAADINEKFESLEVEDILMAIKKKFLSLEKTYVQDNNVESWSLADSIDDVINNFGKVDNIGLSINGAIVSEIINGAELGALTIRSLASGIGKTRLAVADACKLAYPFSFDLKKQKWVHSGHGSPVLFIMTEQTPEQILRMVVAYLTGIEDSNLRFGRLSNDERKRVSQAQEMIHNYSKNFELMRIPDPNVEQLKLAVREKIITTGAQYVFFDYIFVSPNLLQEFRGSNLRNDEALLLMATALKDLAVELGISVFTSTQVNAKVDDNSVIRNEATLAGGRSTINKADNGIIGARPTKEELDFLSNDIIPACGGVKPNIVFDVFKVRSGRWTQVRVWSYFDTGNLRLEDLFVTDSQFNLQEGIFESGYSLNWEISSQEQLYLDYLNGKDET
jgi:replicative DNA helicase